jgi:hypothetical protein
VPGSFWASGISRPKFAVQDVSVRRGGQRRFPSPSPQRFCRRAARDLPGTIRTRVSIKGDTPDDARQQLADRVVDHLELSGFEIDEAEQVMRKRPPTPRHG